MPQTRQPIQGTQPTGISQISRPAQNQQAQTPMQTTGAPAGIPSDVQSNIPPVKKKSKWWIWLIIALIVIGAAVAAYFIFKPF